MTEILAFFKTYSSLIATFFTGFTGCVAWWLAKNFARKEDLEKLEEKVDNLASSREVKELSIPKHADIKADFRSVKVENGIPKVGSTRTKGTDGKQRHGDSVIAAALAIQAAKQQTMPFEYKSVGVKRTNYNNIPIFNMQG
ncbi:MAG: DUF2730 family protein [Proteobacteria bacterium]|nr:DUF2730 family protein [Pseudomonadota bacterium]